MTSAFTRAGGVVVAVALLAACTGGGEPVTPSSTPTPTASTTAEASSAEPVVVQALLDGETVDLEVGPLAVHDGAAVLRLAAPTSYSTLAMAFWHVYESIGSPAPNGVRLVDLEAGTVTRVLRSTDDRVVATRNGSPEGPATEAADAAVGEDTTIVYAAFPVPDTATVDVLLPEVGWVQDVAVVPASQAGTLTVPPAELVEGSLGEAETFVLEEFSEAHDGNVRARRTTEQVAVTVASDVLFAFDSDRLAPEADGALQTAAAQVAAHGAGELAVVGHTDDQGDEPYNVDLSQRRAATVAARLAELTDLTAFDVTVEGRGESQPVVAGTGDAERALNRRVELVLVPDVAADAAAVDVVEESGSLPEPAGPSAPGATGLSVVDGDRSFDVRLPEVRRIGRYLVGALEVTNTGSGDLALGSLAGSAWDSRGSFDARLQFAPTNVTLVSSSTRWYPVDYLSDPENDRRDPLTDRIVNGIGPGEVRTVTVVWPDPGTDTVTVDVAPRFRGGKGQIQVAGRSPFRLTDVPVVSG